MFYFNSLVIRALDQEVRDPGLRTRLSKCCLNLYLLVSQHSTQTTTPQVRCYTFCLSFHSLLLWNIRYWTRWTCGLTQYNITYVLNNCKGGPQKTRAKLRSNYQIYSNSKWCLPTPPHLTWGTKPLTLQSRKRQQRVGQAAAADPAQTQG